MNTRRHEGPHRGFVRPDGAGPESEMGVAKKGNREAPSSSLGLTSGSERLDEERRQESQCPHAQARYGDEGHGSVTHQPERGSRSPFPEWEIVQLARTVQKSRENYEEASFS